MLLRAADHRRMPWKNGGGETLEIAIAPPGATTGDFDWRVSMATVAADGPFSAFADIDRTLVLLAGDGMVLRIGGRPDTILREGDKLAFPADVATSATLTGGPIADLNVMTRRGRYTHSVERIEAPRDVTVAAGTVVLLLGDGLAIESGRGAAELGHLDGARIDGPASLHLRPAPDKGALLIGIRALT